LLPIGILNDSPQEIWQPIGTGILGPMRPELPFMRAARKRQAEILRNKESLLLTAEAYPFAWGELIELVTPAFLAHPRWPGLRTGLQHGLASPAARLGSVAISVTRSRPEETGPLPDSELFTFANSLMLEEFKRMPIEQLLEGPAVLAYLLRNALGKGLSQPAQVTGVIRARNQV
jgi:hypothetical protein